MSGCDYCGGPHGNDDHPDYKPSGPTCLHRNWTLRPGGLESCTDCGEPMGVLKQERGPAADLVIYDEEAPDA